MLAVEFKDVEVDYCPSCGGCWLDRGELELLIGNTAIPFPAKTKGRRLCPHCRKKMYTGPLSTTEIEVDVCPQHGLWLDQGELQAVIQSGGPTAETSTLAAYCKEVFGK
ncbi:MAG: hypothetical protein A2X46_12030 [Lentisphaerae bacterium GWF2_57_35]|nr:MAG: hypothetical protein A2X46_12030 [Lentisphaerae bacterium GWF2_57_35]